MIIERRLRTRDDRASERTGRGEGGVSVSKSAGAHSTFDRSSCKVRGVDVDVIAKRRRHCGEGARRHSVLRSVVMLFRTPPRSKGRHGKCKQSAAALTADDVDLKDLGYGRQQEAAAVAGSVSRPFFAGEVFSVAKRRMQRTRTRGDN